MDPYSTERPCNIDYFQRLLDLACRDQGTELRLVWGPELIIRRPSQVFRKYPHPTLKVRKTIRRRGNLVVGFEVNHPGLPLWIIEERMREGRARELHAKHRFYKGVDVLGEFPAEGWWEWRGFISRHKPDGSCCKENPECRGEYRDPNENDIVEVRKALKDRREQPVLRGLDERPLRREVEQAAKQRVYELEKADDAAIEKLTEELGQEIELAVRPAHLPSVYVDLRKVKDVSTTSN